MGANAGKVCGSDVGKKMRSTNGEVIGITIGNKSSI